MAKIQPEAMMSTRDTADNIGRKKTLRLLVMESVDVGRGIKTNLLMKERERGGGGGKTKRRRHPQDKRAEKG